MTRLGCHQSSGNLNSESGKNKRQNNIRPYNAFNFIHRKTSERQRDVPKQLPVCYTKKSFKLETVTTVNQYYSKFNHFHSMYRTIQICTELCVRPNVSQYPYCIAQTNAIISA